MSPETKRPAKAKPKARTPHARVSASPKRNVLITGVSSTVGRHLAMHLMNDPRVGIVLGTGEGSPPHFFQSFDRERFRYVQADILRSRQLKNLFGSREFQAAGVNTVVHLAFISDPAKRGERIHRFNVEGTKNLLDKCIDSGVQKFVFKSSDVVYKLDSRNPVFLDEMADLNHDPTADQWVKDRVAAEMICRAKMDAPNTTIVILRFTNIIGRNINAQLNAYFDGNVIFKAAGFDPLINLIHMKDVIEAIRLAIFKANKSNIFNIAGNDTAPISTFAELNRRTCISLPETLLPVVNFAMRKLRLTDYYYSVDRERMKYPCLLDTTRARTVLGFEPSGAVEFREPDAY
jgi:UDP-glucose 4-epimerase